MMQDMSTAAAEHWFVRVSDLSNDNSMQWLVLA